MTQLTVQNPSERPTPERCVEAHYLQWTRFENIVDRTLRRRQLAEDGNVEIGGRASCQVSRSRRFALGRTDDNRH